MVGSEWYQSLKSPYYLDVYQSFNKEYKPIVKS